TAMATNQAAPQETRGDLIALTATWTCDTCPLIRSVFGLPLAWFHGDTTPPIARGTLCNHTQSQCESKGNINFLRGGIIWGRLRTYGQGRSGLSGGYQATLLPGTAHP